MSDNKKEYKKPRLNIVELATEEVLAAGCKYTGATIGPGGVKDCLSGLSPCSAPGS